MIEKYSVAICPPDNIVDEVAQMKQLLDNEIGWYNSKNSKAHITISQFVIAEDDLENINNYLTAFSTTEDSLTIEMNKVDYYKNGAVYLAINEESKLALTGIIKRFQKSLNVEDVYHSKDPHLSIARKLDKAKVEIALKMFDKVNLSFICDNIALRKLNPEKRQYDVVERFYFKGEPRRTDAQLGLF